MNELALFAGAGGGILASHLLGWRTVCAVEVQPYAQGVLLSRQNERHLAPFPIWDDVRTFDGNPWRGVVDVVSGGFPCQDISCAGAGKGLAGERSGLFYEMLRIIDEVQPRYVFAENVPALRTRGLATILEEATSRGYRAAWDIFGAKHRGAPHWRERLWLLATNTNESLHTGRAEISSAGKEPALGIGWPAEPRVSRVVNGLARRMDRHAAVGNGQVPCVAASAFLTLQSVLESA